MKDKFNISYLIGNEFNSYGYLFNPLGKISEKIKLIIFGRMVSDRCYSRKLFNEPDCAHECFILHEKAHIEWFKKNRPDACKGRPKGTNPKLEPGDLDKTECYAYTKSLECFEKWRLKLRMSGQSSRCPYFVERNIEYQKDKKEYFCNKTGEN